MIIPLDKMAAVNTNKYAFTRASMIAVDKLDRVDKYLDSDQKWKIVSHTLRLMLDGTLHFTQLEDEYKRGFFRIRALVLAGPTGAGKR
jgi:hypothetical protein